MPREIFRTKAVDKRAKETAPIPSNIETDKSGQNNVEKKSAREAIKKRIRRWLAMGIMAVEFGVGAEVAKLKLENPAVYCQDVIEKVREKEKLTPEQTHKLADLIYQITNQIGERGASWALSYLERNPSQNLGEVGFLSDVLKNFKKAEKSESVESTSGYVYAKESPPKIEGADDIGLTEKESSLLKRAWSEDYYPKGTVNGKVKQILLKKNFLKLGKEYGNKAGAKAFGTADSFKNIVLIKDIKDIRDEKERRFALLGLDWVFSHELGHQNSWMFNRSLSGKERIEFLSDVLKNFKKAEKSESVESMSGYVYAVENSDKEIETYVKVTEWWAELCQNYFSYPQYFKEYFPQESALVEKWLKINPADYDAQAKKDEKEIVLYGEKFNG